MKVLSGIDEFRAVRAAQPGNWGFVPTMGYLHAGHLALIRRAKAECDHVTVSIFINPTQFGANEDLSKYPRDMERDLSLIAPLGTDLVWTPDSDSMYPAGFQTWVEVDALTQTLEGAARPTHFRGVTTVVTKLFNVVQPQRAYFGQKDAQQAAVIRRMARDLNFPIEIITCPTVREADGLAMSSRNKYLTAEQRPAARVLFRALSAGRESFEAGERDAGKIRQRMREVLAGEPLAQPQYVSCADYDSLTELDAVTGKALLSMAVMFGNTRLIDNLVIESV